MTDDVDFSDKSDDYLAVRIANYERSQMSLNDPTYRQLLDEKAARFARKTKLDVWRSIDHLKEAATGERFTTYGALAAASGLTWAEARMYMDGERGHLNQVTAICHSRGWPLLTALCVNKDDIAVGELRGVALIGFAKCARRFGRPELDDHALYIACRDECWYWGRKQPQPPG